MSDNDLLEFEDEDESKSDAVALSTGSSLTWRILIIDDEKDVHSATKFALRNTIILNRPLEFLHATSSKEAVDVLEKNKNIAVILLDVVMETPNAGLDLIATIRTKLKNTQSRIILRTGQPNQAPELEVIRDYDINDYKLKSELTQNKLYASLTTAVRSYQQIKLIESGNRGLDIIVRSSNELMSHNNANDFSTHVIRNLSTLLDIPQDGFVCLRPHFSGLARDPMVIAALGNYIPFEQQVLSLMSDDLAQAVALQCVNERIHVQTDYGIAIYIGSHERGDMCCFVRGVDELRGFDKHLMDLFCSNISICADNLELFSRLRDQAYIDSLLKLPNRNALTEEIDKLMAVDHGKNYVLAMVDIDNFAEINAALGQDYGDLLLKAISKRIKASFPSPCMVARVAGDTFGIVGPLEHMDTDRIVPLFWHPFEIGTEQQIISVTSGIVPLEEIDGAGNEAIKNASIVLKLAKHHSRGQAIMFKRDMVSKARDRLDMLRHLRTAYEKELLFLVFQPKFNIDATCVSGFEALLRWKNEDGNFISPSVFIPLAEQSGLIVRMGEWILRTAIIQLQKIHDYGWKTTHISVNMSVAQLNHPDVLDMLERVLSETHINPKFVDLEITESMAMGDVESNLVLLNEIKKLGFSLSIDDFGTGFSSLNYLQKMPIDRLKIDQAFVRTSNTESGREIVEMIIHLGRTLDLTVVAEGVETIAELDTLKLFHCDEIQGYLYGRPMDIDTLFAWMDENRLRFNNDE